MNPAKPYNCIRPAPPSCRWLACSHWSTAGGHECQLMKLKVYVLFFVASITGCSPVALLESVRDEGAAKLSWSLSGLLRILRYDINAIARFLPTHYNKKNMIFLCFPHPAPVAGQLRHHHHTHI